MAKKKVYRELSEEEFKLQVLNFIVEYHESMLWNFFNYWSEKTDDGIMRMQKQETWEIGKRLARWGKNNYVNHAQNSASKSEPISRFDRLNNM